MNLVKTYLTTTFHVVLQFSLCKQTEKIAKISTTLAQSEQVGCKAPLLFYLKKSGTLNEFGEVS